MKELGTRKSLSVRAVLVCGFVAAVVMPVALLGTLAFRQAGKALREQALNQLDAVGEIKRGQIASFFGERLGDVNVLSADPVTVSAMRDLEAAYNAHGADSPEFKSVLAKYDGFFTNYQKEYGYYDVFLIAADGDIVYTAAKEKDFATNLKTGPAAGSNLADLWNAARDKAAVVDFKEYAISNAPAAFVGGPIKDGNGTVGVLAFQLPIDHINTVMQEKTGLGETGETYLVGSDGLLRSDSRFSKDTLLKQEAKTAATQAALKGESGHGPITDYRGKPVLSSWRPAKIEGLDWVVVAEIDEAEVAKPVHALLWAIALAGGVITAIFVAFGLRLAGGVSAGIKRVAGAMGHLAEGDATHKLEVKSADELGLLAGSYNSACGKLSSLLAQARSASDAVGSGSQVVAAGADEGARSSQNVAEATQSIARSVESVGTNAEQARRQMEALAAAIDQVAAGSMTQAQSVSGAETNVGEMVAAIQGVTRLAGQVADAAEESGRNAREGALAVGSSVAAMQRMRENVAKATDLVNDLGQRSAAIGEIVSVIEDVAEQTNLLALNAAIEAARAGEHGKGFAVVADEVRKLAERAATSSGEITALVRQIQAGMVDTVRAQESSAAETEEGAKLVEAAGGSLESILASVSRVGELIGEVSAASAQMTASADQVVAAMGQVAVVTEENSAATEEMAASAQEVRASVDEVALLLESVSAGVEEVSASTEEQTAAAEEISSATQELAASSQELQAMIAMFRYDDSGNGNGSVGSPRAATLRGAS